MWASRRGGGATDLQQFELLGVVEVLALHHEAVREERDQPAVMVSHHLMKQHQQQPHQRAERKKEVTAASQLGGGKEGGMRHGPSLSPDYRPCLPQPMHGTARTLSLGNLLKTPERQRCTMATDVSYTHPATATPHHPPASTTSVSPTPSPSAKPAGGCGAHPACSRSGAWIPCPCMPPGRPLPGAGWGAATRARRPPAPAGTACRTRGGRGA